MYFECPNCHAKIKTRATITQTSIRGKCPHCGQVNVFITCIDVKAKETQAPKNNAKNKKLKIAGAIVLIAGLVVLSSYLFSYCSYSAVIKKRNIEACNQYLEENPDGKYAAEVSALIDELEDEAYDDIDDFPTKERIDDYYRNYPNGKHKACVDSLLFRLIEKEDFETAVLKDSRQALDDFLAKYPDNHYQEYLQKAYERIEHLEALRQDSLDYEEACSQNTLVSWRKYVKDHPAGIFIEQADSNITRLKEEQIIEKYKNNYLSNGSQPYKGTYRANHEYDQNSSFIKVTAPWGADVVVLARRSSGTVEGHIYVRRGQQAQFYLPEGIYNIFFYYGTGWNPHKKITGKHWSVVGGFVLSESVGKDENVYFPAGEGYTYVLQQRINGNFHTEASSVEEMF